jgi:carboxypeptidase C (cathepsin A)
MSYAMPLLCTTDIPALSARIVRGNLRHDGPTINIRGAAIGNGLVDPLVQYKYYPSYAYDHNVISKTEMELMVTMEPGCIALIANCA